MPGPPHRCYWQVLPDLQVNLSPTPSGPNKLFSWLPQRHLIQLTEQNTRKQQYRIHTGIMSGRQHKMALNTRQWHSIRSGHQIQDEFHERSLIQESPLLRSSRMHSSHEDWGDRRAWGSHRRSHRCLVLFMRCIWKFPRAQASSAWEGSSLQFGFEKLRRSLDYSNHKWQFLHLSSFAYL